MTHLEVLQKVRKEACIILCDIYLIAEGGSLDRAEEAKLLESIQKRLQDILKEVWGLDEEGEK